MAVSNGGNGRRVKKTPYQGPSRCHGWFDCDFGHRWDSKTSWANYGQKCKTCVKNGQQKRVTASQAFMIPYTYPHTQVIFLFVFCSLFFSFLFVFLCFFSPSSFFCFPFCSVYNLIYFAYYFPFFIVCSLYSPCDTAKGRISK